MDNQKTVHIEYEEKHKMGFNFDVDDVDAEIVIVEEGMEKTSCFSFSRCHNNLKKVVFPNSMKLIEKETFKDCVKLEEINIPDSVEYIGYNAFKNCKSLKEITIPKTTKLGGAVFKGCDQLSIVNGKDFYNDQDWLVVDGELCDYRGTGAKVTVPNCVKSMGSCVFCGNNEIEDIFFPDSVESITGALYNMGSLKTVRLPYTVKECSLDCSFSPQLKEIKLPLNTKEIPSRSFYECSSLEKITIPDGVKKVGGYAFWFCTSLREIILPDSVEEVENNAFEACENLERLEMNPKMISYDIFARSDKIKKLVIGDNVEFIANNAFSYISLDAEIYASISIRNAFQSNNSCTDLFVPAMVKTFVNHQDKYSDVQKEEYKKYISRTKKKLMEKIGEDEAFKKYLEENKMIK